MDVYCIENLTNSNDFIDNKTYPGNTEYFNMSFLKEQAKPYIPMYIYVLVSVINGIIFLFGLCGNFLVVIVIVKSRSMRTPTNFFLLSLSVADILVLLFCQPVALMEFYAKDRWLIGEFMCKLVPLLENGALSVSIMTMIAVTVERYVAICHLFKRNINCDSKTAVKVNLVIWIIGFLLCSPFLSMTVLEDALFYDGTLIQVCRTRVNTFWRKAYIIFVFVVFFALPVFILVFTYSRIVKQLISESLKLFASEHDRSAKFTLKLRKQVVRMLIIIVLLFFLSLCPIRIVTLWLIFTPTERVVSIGLEGYLNLISFARIMMYINSAVNPFIYNMTSYKFKAAFRKVLQRHSSRTTSVSRKYNFNQNRQLEENHNLCPPCENVHLYQTSPRIIVKLLLYTETDKPASENAKSEVIDDVYPLHVIYEEESSNFKKEED